MKYFASATLLIASCLLLVSQSSYAVNAQSATCSNVGGLSQDMTFNWSVNQDGSVTYSVYQNGTAMSNPEKISNKNTLFDNDGNLVNANGENPSFLIRRYYLSTSPNQKGQDEGEYWTLYGPIHMKTGDVKSINSDSAYCTISQ